MSEKKKAMAILFTILLVMFLGGIAVHQLTGYRYPAIKANDFEFNKLNDLYEAFVVIPVGLIGLWTLRRNLPVGPVIVSGIAVWTIYNYAMMVTGRQNLWVFLWVAKLAVSGPLALLCWEFLPARIDAGKRTRIFMIGYLALIGVAFGKLMGQRLLASAGGRMVDMSMVGKSAADWGDPALRDPIVFFALVLPVVAAAIWGLISKSSYGSKFTTLLSVFTIGIVSVILFTGPLKQRLQSETVSAAMMGMSAFMTAFTIPAVIWITRSLKGSRNLKGR